MAKRKLTHEQFIAALHIYRERNCADCGWLTAALHWWCTNQKAIDARGTTFPGICHCPWWKPDRDYIRKQLRELPTQSKKPHSRIQKSTFFGFIHNKFANPAFCKRKRLQTKWTGHRLLWPY